MELKDRIEQFIEKWGHIVGHQFGSAVISDHDKCESELFTLLEQAVREQRDSDWNHVKGNFALGNKNMLPLITKSLKI